ncbi:hypothetical protein [Candidatus Magnetominusculus dajiuhuensis]|uniref:hypothetical protein n=1 Tax=Candidatus Magnetominusculus dajiuhuensis TaxID=3137712 RepID=UPI003B4300A2
MNYSAYGTIDSTSVRHANRAERKILRYAVYGDEWYCEQGRLPSAKVVKQAIELLHTAQAYSFFVDSTVGADGEIELVVYHDNDRLQFIITENNGIEFGHERKSDLLKPFLPEDETEEICYEEGVTFDDAITKINHFGRGIWITTNTSALSNETGYTSTSLRLKKEDSAVVHSGIRQTGQGSLAYLLVA